MSDALSNVKDDVETIVSTSSQSSPFKYEHGQRVFFIHKDDKQIKIVSGCIYDSEISRKRDGVIYEKYCLDQIQDKDGVKINSIAIEEDYFLFPTYEDVIAIL